MPETKGTQGLEVAEDLAFQEKEWKVERAGWIVGLLVLLAALAGLFGSGPLSSAAVEEGPLRVEYHRFIRYQSPEALTIQMDAAQAGDGRVRLWLGREYLSGFEVQKIVPEPDQVQLFADRIVYEFQTPESEGPLQITVQMKPNRTGTQRGQLGSENTGEGAAFTQFVYP